jgi:hypothetical protein
MSPLCCNGSGLRWQPEHRKVTFYSDYLSVEQKAPLPRFSQRGAQMMAFASMDFISKRFRLFMDSGQVERRHVPGHDQVTYRICDRRAE